MIERLSLPDVRALAQDCLTRAGAPDRVAQAVAAEVAAAEAAGERQHGIEALLRDIRLMRYGRIETTARPQISRPRPGLMHCDAGHGFAAAALEGTVGALHDLARQQGIALLRLDRASDPGAMIGVSGVLAGHGLAVLAFGAVGAGRIAHPDISGQATLRNPPRDALAMLLPSPKGGQPADGPLDGPVSHGAWIVALDLQAAGDRMLAADIWSVVPAAPLAREIAFSTELLQQLVTA